MTVAPIRRLDRPTAADLDAAIAANQPVILRGLMDDQPAARWDLPSLRARLGQRSVKVVTHDQPRLYWDPAKGLPLRPQPFDSFVDSGLGSAAGGHSYLQDDINNLPMLKDDYRLPPMMASRAMVRTKLWLSGAGLITPLHYDPVETLHWVIRGTKRFVCYRPGVGRYYPYPARSTAPFISQVDPDQPDLARFPRFAKAAPLEFRMSEGEILYLPTYWWHQVYSESDVNLSLNFVWFASRWKSWRHLGQHLRARRHVARGLAAAKAAARAARAEELAVEAPTARAEETSVGAAPPRESATAERRPETTLLLTVDAIAAANAARLASAASKRSAKEPRV